MAYLAYRSSSTQRPVALSNLVQYCFLSGVMELLVAVLDDQLGDTVLGVQDGWELALIAQLG